ncbi:MULTISPECIES: hypothetical protein [unclassified Streptomyces]|uniref:hypothetical protein n=1 Tax=unclassified Streptomyces TaxID=2593676 RepID=UPI0022B6CD06|nr:MULTISPECIES: hypothetical protein [unclassified Streptomyces]MCZ7415415.1 hypothetical protein [Streptomyces sp. WMMC897]MCZ7417851.1 hypothetical protein [Streptomyces sp. WMMC897]MCZ7417877.1 hypothetical protein [Streptomyces sp. WMMC897]MCZ7432344.1 hypothetical protein [Streptomyces sp. WMMC1477]
MGARGKAGASTSPRLGTELVVAAFASLGAGAIHLAAGPDHFAEWRLAGVFFYALGAFQVIWAAMALRGGGRWAVAFGLTGAVGALGTWAVSRTVGMPVGPAAGQAEEFGRAGLTAAVLQVVVVLALVSWLIRRGRGFGSALTAVLVAGVMAAGTTQVTVPAVRAALEHSHAHGTDGETEPHGHDEDGDEPHGHDEDTAPETPTDPAGSDPGAEPEPSTPPASEKPHEDDGHEH